MGAVSPSVDDVARVYAKKNGAKIQATGAYAANLLGFSDQVPGRVVFLTDGPTGKVKIKNLQITFKKTTVRSMASAGTREALVIQVFKFMKKEHIDKFILEKTKNILKASKRKEFEKNVRFAPLWIRALLFNLLEDTQ